jgi:hypothetical protein
MYFHMNLLQNFQEVLTNFSLTIFSRTSYKFQEVLTNFSRTSYEFLINVLQVFMHLLGTSCELHTNNI